MNEKQRKLMFELFTGTLISQEIIILTLHKNGFLRKQEVMERLDHFIDYFETKGSEQVAVPMRYLRKNLGKQASSRSAELPRQTTQQYPEWFHGVIPGGRHSKDDNHNGVVGHDPQ